MNTELVEVARRENNSVLRGRDFNGLASLSFSDIETEIETSCPLFYQFLYTAIECEHDTEKKQAAFVLVYSIKKVQKMSWIEQTSESQFSVANGEWSYSTGTGHKLSKIYYLLIEWLNLE